MTQENTLLGTLTVRETINYSANLRLPSSMSKEQVMDVVEGTIQQMGLSDCADRLIGNWHLRGISGGEKKRLSIALEILTHPRLLFLDEPTTGLDSASAFFVAQTLRLMAHEGKTVVSSIHQPSGEVYNRAKREIIHNKGRLPLECYVPTIDRHMESNEIEDPALGSRGKPQDTFREAYPFRSRIACVEHVENSVNSVIVLFQSNCHFLRIHANGPMGRLYPTLT